MPGPPRRPRLRAQRRQLLVVRDLARKRRLAARAATEGWTKDELREAIGSGARGAAVRHALGAALRSVAVAAKRVGALAEHPAEPLGIPEPDQEQLLAFFERTRGILATALAAARQQRTARRRLRRARRRATAQTRRRRMT